MRPKIMRLKNILKKIFTTIRNEFSQTFEPVDSIVFSRAFSTYMPYGPLTEEEAADLMEYIDSFPDDEEESSPDK